MTPTELKTTLDDLGLSQAEFARLIGGASSSTVWRWLSGERAIPPPVEAVLVLLKRFDEPAQKALRAHWENRGL